MIFPAVTTLIFFLGGHTIGVMMILGAFEAFSLVLAVSSAVAEGLAFIALEETWRRISRRTMTLQMNEDSILYEGFDF